MILGIGTDLANIDRIQKTIDRFGQRFKIVFLHLSSKIKPKKGKI